MVKIFENIVENKINNIFGINSLEAGNKWRIYQTKVFDIEADIAHVSKAMDRVEGLAPVNRSNRDIKAILEKMTKKLTKVDICLEKNTGPV